MLDSIIKKFEEANTNAKRLKEEMIKEINRIVILSDDRKHNKDISSSDHELIISKKKIDEDLIYCAFRGLECFEIHEYSKDGDNFLNSFCFPVYFSELTDEEIKMETKRLTEKCLKDKKELIKKQKEENKIKYEEKEKREYLRLKKKFGK